MQQLLMVYSASAEHCCVLLVCSTDPMQQPLMACSEHCLCSVGAIITGCDTLHHKLYVTCMAMRCITSST